MENALERFSVKIFGFLTGELDGKKGLLIKKHSEHLRVRGDFSFPNTLKSWHEFFKQNSNLENTDNDLMRHIDKTPEDLIEKSKTWKLHVNNVMKVKGRLHLFLDRPVAIRVGLIEALKNNDYVLEKINQGTTRVLLDPLCEDDKCITSLRLKYLTKVAQDLYAITVRDTEVEHQIVLSSKSSRKGAGRHMIICGTVINLSTGSKEREVTADDYIKSRQNEMALIARHKYGLRPALDPKWKEFTEHLGESAVVFELLQTKPASPVKINVDCPPGGSKKGASFVLYNCARLSSILNSYNKMVEDGSYSSLPDIEETDLSLLTQEDEWNLIFNYILGLPSLIKSCLRISDEKCEFNPHHICNFLSSMVKVFSQYYRKIRILTQPRQHLMPEMYARIHMLRVLHNTLRTCLLILDIKSVSHM